MIKSALLFVDVRAETVPYTFSPRLRSNPVENYEAQSVDLDIDPFRTFHIRMLITCRQSLCGDLQISSVVYLQEASWSQARRHRSPPSLFRP